MKINWWEIEYQIRRKLIFSLFGVMLGLIILLIFLN